MNRRQVLRRQVLQGSVAGAFTLWASPRMFGQQARLLTDKLSVVEVSGANTVLFSSADVRVVVDSGPKVASAAKAQVLFNTHYHTDQTGNNGAYAAGGAKIVAHQRTRQYMSADVWVPDQERYEKARPQADRPTETFLTTGSLNAGGEQIDYGYLPMAHTSGDIYVYFKTSNVLVAGDVASPLRDPAFDFFTGAWIGGRVDALDILLGLANDQTKIVPAYGAVMTRAELKAERDLLEEVRARLFKQVREGDGPKDMLEAGVLKGLPRTWKDPEKFLYDAAKGLWAHHDKLDPNVV
jgi:glyoxylase-like metal-dependent hydrolase (beta-lactamase superfamily II)